MTTEPSPSGIYEYNLDTGLFEHTTPEGATVTATPEVLTGGRYTVRSGRWVDSSTGRYAMGLGGIRGTTVLALGEGRIASVAPVTTDMVNRPEIASGDVGTIFSGELRLPDGSVRQLTDQFISVRPLGELVVEGTSPTGVVYHTSIDASLVDPVTLAIQDHPELKVLTGAGATERALIGYLFDKQRELLGQLVEQGTVDESGSVIDNESDAAAFLARSLSSGVRHGVLMELP